MKRILHLIGVHLIGLATICLPMWAGEYVVLENGFRLHAERHEISGDQIRIYTDGGVTELPAAGIAGYEQDELAAKPKQQPANAAQPAGAEMVQLAPSELASSAARKFSLPESFVRSVMKAESGFQPSATSPKGAIGLMQLMPETAQKLGVDPRIPEQNAEGGAEYLRELLAKYENDPNQVVLALAAYNAGPGAVERYHGVPPFRETRDYILRVLKNWDQTQNK